MKYNGIELKEFTSDEPVLFNPPRKMLVWDRADSEPCERDVVGYFPNRICVRKVITTTDTFTRCAEIPEPSESRRATNLELAKWLAAGNGENLDRRYNTVYHEYSYGVNLANESVPPTHVIRKWDEVKWHEPTTDYMGL